MTKAPEHKTSARQGRRVERIFDAQLRNERGRIYTIPNAPPTPLAERLRQLRYNADLDQKEMARLLNTGANRISDWELGVVIPSLAILQRYARAFDTTVSKILQDVM